MQVGPVSGYGYSFYPSNVDYGKTSTENENIDKTGNEKKMRKRLTTSLPLRSVRLVRTGHIRMVQMKAMFHLRVPPEFLLTQPVLLYVHMKVNMLPTLTARQNKIMERSFPQQ